MIVSAAVKVVLDDYAGTEVIIPVHRHKDALIICQRLLGYKPFVSAEGFLTDTDEFLDRAVAAIHACEYGQLDWLGEADKESVMTSEYLMSEDLW